MYKCTCYWNRYMHTMALSRQMTDPLRRQALVREAYNWLQWYFDAEDQELSRRRAVLSQR